MRFRVFDKKEEKHYSDAEYFLACDGDLYYEDIFEDRMLRNMYEYFVIQHSTGLKDICGQEIFEGDYLCWSDHSGCTRYAQVVFSPKLAAFVLDTSGRHLIDDKYGDYRPMHYQDAYKITQKQ